MAQAIKPGIYRHYLGRDVLVPGIVTEQVGGSRGVLLYGLKEQRWWMHDITPSFGFLDLVQHEGKEVPRFRLLAPDEVDHAKAMAAVLACLLNPASAIIEAYGGAGYISPSGKSPGPQHVADDRPQPPSGELHHIPFIKRY